MGPVDNADPKQFLHGFFSSSGRELMRGDEDAGVVVDRHHTPAVVPIADGQRTDREQRRAHMLPRTLPDVTDRP